MPTKRLIGSDPNQVSLNGMLGRMAFMDPDALRWLLLAAGSAVRPSLRFIGDEDTGLNSPGPDQLALVTGGVPRLTVDSSGTVAIDGMSTAPTAQLGTNTNQLATTAFVVAEIDALNIDQFATSAFVQSFLEGINAAIDLKAPIASPEFSGTPTADTALRGTNTNQLATTAFVINAIDDGTY
jgi:hypothetical protein